MGTRKLSVSYLSSIDTLFVHFETKPGFYDFLDDDERVSARYDVEGRLIGFMIEGLREFEDWTDFELPETDSEQAERHAKSRVSAANLS